MFSYYASSGSVSDGNYLTFPTSMVNIGGRFDGTIFTCNIHGYYDFSFAGNVNKGSDTTINVLKNGSTEVKFYLEEDNDDYKNFAFSWQMKLYSGDKVGLYVTKGKIYADGRGARIFNGNFIRGI